MPRGVKSNNSKFFATKEYLTQKSNSYSFRSFGKKTISATNSMAAQQQKDKSLRSSNKDEAEDYFQM